MTENTAIHTDTSTLHIKDSRPEVWVLEDASYIIKKNRDTQEDEPIIMLFARNYNNKFETAVHFVNGFEPYFYCPQGEISHNPKIKRIERCTLNDADGRPVWRVVTHLPKDVPEVRNEFSWTDMADFVFEKRFLIDKGIQYAYVMEDGQPIPTNVPEILIPRIMYFDIEVRSPENVMPLPTYPKFPIVSIQTMDSYTGKIVVFTNGIPPTQDPEHCACYDEYELYKMFMDYIKEKNPDVISGWNSNGYDFPYIIKRAEEIGVSCKGLARVGFPFASFRPTGEWDIMIKGRSTLDMMDAFKKLMIMKSQRESYALKEVSRDFGFEYIDYGSKIDALFQLRDWETFLKYGKNDVIALKTIDEHSDVLLHQFYETVRMITGTRLNDVLYNSRLLEMKAMHMGIKPMRTKQQVFGDCEKFEGALVLLPPPGIHKDVGTVDLASLYPTIMMAFPEETSPDVDLVFIKMLEVFVDMRNILRKQRLEGDNSTGTALQEYAYKVLANCVYGVAGARRFRQYKRKGAEFVTETGRNLGRYIHYCLSLIGKTTIYGDSISGDSTIRVFTKENTTDPITVKNVKIEDLFTHLGNKINEKEYCHLTNMQVETINRANEYVLDDIDYVMRHLVDKQMYRITLVTDATIDVTEDHSVFIYNLHKGTISTIKSKNLFGKYVIVNNHGSIDYARVKTLEKLESKPMYVYDLHIAKSHKFFANDILVHNTDSAFFYPVVSPEDGLNVQEYLNEELIKWGREKGAKVQFKLKFEKLYRTILFKVDSTGKRAAKKKYCGHLVWEEGDEKNELNYKGLELKRSDQSVLSKTCLHEFLRLSLVEDDIDGAMTLVKSTYDNALKGKIDPFDISIPRAIRKIDANSPHARGIINTKQYYNYTIQDGSKPRLLHLVSHPYEICIDEDMPTAGLENSIDWPLMIEKTITKKMESYVSSAGRNWDEVIHNQKTLFDFI